MKKIATISFAALLTTVCVLSCTKAGEDADLPVKATPHSSLQSNIMWHDFDESCIATGDEEVMKLYREMMGMDVFVISHPDSASVGVLPYSNPAAEVFRSRIGDMMMEIPNAK